MILSCMLMRENFEDTVRHAEERHLKILSRMLRMDIFEGTVKHTEKGFSEGTVNHTEKGHL